MKAMFHEQVVPRLPITGRVIRRARIHCFGLGESAVEEMLGELTARGREPEMGITAHEATITLRIIAHGTSVEECDRQIEQARREIHRCMGHYVFGEEDDELEHVVVRLLKQAGKTMASAETGTGGLLAHRVTDVDGHLECYRGSLVLPNKHALCTVLDLDPEALDRDGAVSEATARSMALACREKFSTDFALAITEVPARATREPGAEPPLTWIALAGPESVRTCRHVLVGDWTIAKSRAVKQALNMLRLELTGAAKE
jgi:nicotinamide-nucleotide amidase